MGCLPSLRQGGQFPAEWDLSYLYLFITGGLAQHLFVVSPTNLQLMPCVPGITLPPRDRGESAEPRLSGWILEVVLRGSSLQKNVLRITLGTWERSEESLQELLATNKGLRTSLEAEELYTTTIRRRIPHPRYRLLYCYSEFESVTIPPSQSIYIFARQEEGKRSNKVAVHYRLINSYYLQR